MIGVAAALAVWSGLFPSWVSPTSVQRFTPVKGWILEVRPDRFTGEKACAILGRNMSYRHGVLTFRFGSRVDTANALYRIDQGEAGSVGLVAPEAAGLGADFKSQNLKNPSDGRVYIPTSKLQTARSVSIRPNPKRHPTSFSLVGFAQALSAAKAQGCDVA